MNSMFNFVRFTVCSVLLFYSARSNSAEDYFAEVEVNSEAAWSLKLSGSPTGGKVILRHCLYPSLYVSIDTTPASSLASLEEGLVGQLSNLTQSEYGDRGFDRVSHQTRLVGLPKEMVFYSSFFGRWCLESTDGGIDTISPVTNLTCNIGAENNLEFNWTLPAGGLDAIYIYGRGVAPITRVAGTATGFTLNGTVRDPLNSAVLDFSVVGVKNGLPSKSARVAILSPQANIFFNVSTVALPNGNLNQPYNFQLQSINAIGAVVYSVTQGMLPAGITIQQNGSIVGIPTLPGDYSILIKVSDAEAHSTFRCFDLKILP